MGTLAEGRFSARHSQIIDRGHSSIQRILRETGGIRPKERKRSSLALTLAEREVISRGLAMRLSMRTIASQLGRSPTTVSREINRNGGYACYRASVAEEAAWRRALRPKACKLAGRPYLVREITRKLRCQWSPEQIAGWLKRCYPNDERYHVSHETIYKNKNGKNGKNGDGGIICYSLRPLKKADKQLHNADTASCGTYQPLTKDLSNK